MVLLAALFPTKYIIFIDLFAHWLPCPTRWKLWAHASVARARIAAPRRATVAALRGGRHRVRSMPPPPRIVLTPLTAGCTRLPARRYQDVQTGELPAESGCQADCLPKNAYAVSGAAHATAPAPPLSECLARTRPYIPPGSAGHSLPFCLASPRDPASGAPRP